MNDTTVDTDTVDVDREDLVRVESPFRPLPRAARKKLRANHEIVEWIESDETGRNGGVLLTEWPSEQLLEDYELTVIRDPELVYHTDSDEIVEIYTDPDEVLVDGYDAHLSVQEAVTEAEKQDRFTLQEGDPADVLD